MENTPENKLFCQDCGSETAADSDFCPFCGARLDKSSESLESREGLESLGSPGSLESESVASALADASGSAGALQSGSAGASGSEPGAVAAGPNAEEQKSEPSTAADEISASSEDEDDLEPTVLYSSAEFEKLTTGEMARETGGESVPENAVEDQTAEEITEKPKKSKRTKKPKSVEAAETAGAVASGPGAAETPAEEKPIVPAPEPGEDTIEDVPLDAPPAPPEWLTAGAPEAETAAEAGAEAKAEAGAEAKAEAGAEAKAEAGAVTGSEEDERAFTSQIEEADDTGGKKKSKQLQTLTEGTLLNGRYEIVRKIGGGGMGAVYLASDRNLGGVLRAVKEMVQSYIEAEQQEKALADFKRESLLLTSLEHPCIPTVYDYFYDENAGRFYLVMKYISGGDLAARLRSAPEGRVDEKSVTEWAAQTADVLDYLHSRRPPIVYRDLKPSNLMIDGNSGRIMLVDFGIARWVTKDEKGVTAVGTMGYAPPELFSGNVEPRSDIYSLGATMFHLLTGADPQSNPLLIFDFSKHPRPRQVNPNVSNEMEQILMRAVEYSIELRYNSAGELREALIQHLESVRYGRLTYGAPRAYTTGMPIPAGTVSGQSMVFCGFCGEKIIATDVFCPYCGAKQAVADQQQQHQQQMPRSVAAFPPQPQGRVLARVTVLGTGELNPPTYSLEKLSNVVGQARSADEHFSRGRSFEIRSADENFPSSRAHLEGRRDLYDRRPRFVERHGGGQFDERSDQASAASPLRAGARQQVCGRRYDFAFCSELTILNLDGEMVRGFSG